MRKINISKDDVLHMYFDLGMSYSEIAYVYECNSATICNRIKEWGVSARSTSDSLKGREITWGDKISESNIGRVVSDSTREKMSKSATGRTSWNKGLRKSTSPEKIKYGKSGSSHWAWKGGVSKYEVLVRQTSEYKNWRDCVFSRDDYTCCSCGLRGGYLEAHHIVHMSDLLRSSDFETLWNVDNGMTLCKKCHKEAHHAS